MPAAVERGRRRPGGTDAKLEHSAALRLRRLEHPRHGQEWRGLEETQLLAAFRDGRSIKELSAEHHRSEVAIRRRLLKLGVAEHELADRQPSQPS